MRIAAITMAGALAVSTTAFAQSTATSTASSGAEYTTEQLKILEVLRSLDELKKRLVTAPIDHFSRYAVAY